MRSLLSYRNVLRVTAACLGIIAASANAQTPLAQLQADFMKLHFGMFLHYNMSTYTGEQWASQSDPNKFSPTNLNCGQWADAAKAAGMTYMVLTAKHHDGFCIWPSSRYPC